MYPLCRQSLQILPIYIYNTDSPHRVEMVGEKNMIFSLGGDPVPLATDRKTDEAGVQTQPETVP